MNCNCEAKDQLLWYDAGTAWEALRWGRSNRGLLRERWRWRAHHPGWGLRDLGSAPGSGWSPWGERALHSRVQLLVQGDPLEEKGHSTPVFLPRESRGLQRVRHDWASEPMHRSSRNRRGLYKQYYYVRSNKTWHDRLWEGTELVKILLSFFTLIIMYHKGVWGKHISLTISMLILIWSRASEGIYLGI